MNTELARFNMIEQQIRPWEVLDPNVLQLLSTVKREDFVPAAMKALAFVDTQVPLPGGAANLARLMSRGVLVAKIAGEYSLEQIVAACDRAAKTGAERDGKVIVRIS